MMRKRRSNTARTTGPEPLYRPCSPSGFNTPKMSAENGKAVGADVIKEAVCISADPEDHIELAQRYIDMGFDHLIFHSAGPDQRAFLVGYGRDVLPRLRKAPKAKPADCSSSNPRQPDKGFIDEHTP